MAVYETSRSLNEGVRADARGFFASLFATVATWNDRRVTRNALSALTARELEDIGLNRDDIYNV
ncbi:uncharacterized protein YjiS (DUF1127 family) [Litoreibacter halocynthiae]|uniref:Uncharacterized protein YjiS (DUF1127 family) n=1 Tax=Litoreibacter halocynthiae TaxID=1242689 RepID=A0A4R7LM71_9RHOB|nr:DUF1127 domain-containing protein [Litoreibacter halocynthiae]TDT75230.1 uncharacterized protein YjiS (DUF1127 family) [Litoreibacter halocynthiae]